MKNAKFIISIVEFYCPVCGESISCETGSFLFSIEELPETLQCKWCKLALKIPAKIKKLAIKQTE